MYFLCFIAKLIPIPIFLLVLVSGIVGKLPRKVKLSKPQPNPNLNTKVGFDMKMTVQTTLPPTSHTTQTFQPLLDQLES